VQAIKTIMKKFIFIYIITFVAIGFLLLKTAHADTIIDTVKKFVGIESKKEIPLPKFEIKELEKTVPNQKYTKLDYLKAQRLKNIKYLEALIATSTYEKIK